MRPTEFRPLTAEERRTLARLAREGQGLGHDVLNGLFVALFLFLPSVWGLRLLGHRDDAWVAAAGGLCAATGLVLAVKMHRAMARALGPGRAASAADLAGGRAATQTYDVVDAIRVEEFEDEGSSYFLALADGSVLFLSGQYLYEAEEGGAFPSTRFEVTRAPASGLLLDLRCTGEPLAPSSTRPAFTTADHHAERVPADGDRLAVDFESLRRA